MPTVGHAHALPDSPTVLIGDVAVAHDAPSAMRLVQASDRAMIDWHAFDIEAGHRLDIRQPSSHAVLLNRVTGDAPSTLAGSLCANGAVLLVNPNGIAITESGRIHAAGFIASTIDIETTDFLRHDLGDIAQSLRVVRSPDDNGASDRGIVNAGRIVMQPGGVAALVGDVVEQSGIVIAPGGRIALTGATLKVGGSVDAAGGDVNLRGTRIVVDDAWIDVSDDAGGGNLRIETDGGPAHTQRVEIGREALLSANGARTTLGGVGRDGGSVVVASAGETVFKGHAQAEGVLHGGRVDIIGERQLYAAGRIAVAPQYGHGYGTVHLATDDVRIRDLSQDAPERAAPPSDISVIDAGLLSGALDGGHVVVAARTLAQAQGPQPSTQIGRGGIVVDDATHWSADTTLHLHADSAIVFGAAVTGHGAHAAVRLSHGAAFPDHSHPFTHLQAASGERS